MPSGEGSVCKRKRNCNLPAIETRSLRPCLESSHSAMKTLLPRCPGAQNQTTTGTSVFSDSSCHNASNTLSVAPSISGVISSPTVNVLDSTLNQISVGTSFCVSPSVTRATSLCSSFATSTSHSLNTATKKPFILKLKTNQVKVCQSCRKNYDGANDTLGLVVAHTERRLISNLATGVQFLGKESNSHYHLHLSCLKTADMSFTAKDLVVPDDIKPSLSGCTLQLVLTF